MYGIDYYTLNNMLALSLHDNLIEQKTIFEVFARKVPYKYGVVAGMDYALKTISELKFKEEDIKTLIANGTYLDKKVIEWLLNFKFSGDIFAMDEGQCFLSNEPVATIYASYGEAILIENILLSSLTHSSSVASKASEISLLSPVTLVEMGARRHLPAQAIMTSYASYIAGFSGTSNIDANIKYGIPLFGTVAHSYIQLYQDEETAFLNQNSYFKDKIPVFLIDTYDIDKAIDIVLKLFKEQRFKECMLRLDSGDNQTLYKVKSRLLQEKLSDKIKLILTGNINIDRIRSIDAKIVDVYGIGSHLSLLGVSETIPFVYKMVAVEKNGVYISKTKHTKNKQYIGGVKKLVRKNEKNKIQKHIIYYYDKTCKVSEAISFMLSKQTNLNNSLKWKIKSGSINYEKTLINLIQKQHKRNRTEILGGSTYQDFIKNNIEVEMIKLD